MSEPELHTPEAHDVIACELVACTLGQRHPADRLELRVDVLGRLSRFCRAVEAFRDALLKGLS